MDYTTLGKAVCDLLTTLYSEQMADSYTQHYLAKVDTPTLVHGYPFDAVINVFRMPKMISDEAFKALGEAAYRVATDDQIKYTVKRVTFGGGASDNTLKNINDVHYMAATVHNVLDEKDMLEIGAFLHRTRNEYLEIFICYR